MTIRKKKTDVTLKFPETVLSSLFQKLNGYNGGSCGRRISSVRGFTEYRCTDNMKQLYRCCPTHRGNEDWFDWAMVKWSVDGDEPMLEVEAQLLMFLDMTSICYDPFNPPNGDYDIPSEIIHHDKCVFIHSVSNDTWAKQRKPALPNNRRIAGPVTRIAKFASMCNEYHLVDIHSIAGPAFVITDTCREGTDVRIAGNASTIISIEPMDQWHTKFLDYSDEKFLDDVANKNYDSEMLDENGNDIIASVFECPPESLEGI